MINLENSLQNLFSLPVKVEADAAPSGMIRFMALRNIFSVKVGDVEFIAIELNEKEVFPVGALKKQIDQYSEKFGKNCAYILNTSVKVQLDAFVKNSIPFIAENEQVYLPFFGIALSNNFKDSKRIDSKKMMPATQELFLYMFYNSNKKYFLKSKIAEELNLTRTSMTRASDQLIAMQLVVQKKVGREYRMELQAAGAELYKKAKGFLINPIFDEFYINSEQLKGNELLAGESALSKCSMMNPPEVSCFAVYKDDDFVKTLKKINIRWEESKNPVKIQLWKYNPALFANKDYVDTVSMICSLKDISDERIEGEIEEIIEEERW